MKLLILLPFMLLLASCMESTLDSQEQKPSSRAPQKLENALLLPKEHSFAADEELDLHGKRVKRAKELIESFLEESFKAAKNFVLIITGKGKHSKEKQTLSDGTEVGLIKYNFINWVDNGVFDKFIERISYAHGVHGGEGAFYIKLRK